MNYIIGLLLLPFALWATWAIPSVWRNSDAGLERGFVVGYFVAMTACIYGLSITALTVRL